MMCYCKILFVIICLLVASWCELSSIREDYLKALQSIIILTFPPSRILMMTMNANDDDDDHDHDGCRHPDKVGQMMMGVTE